MDSPKETLTERRKTLSDKGEKLQSFTDHQKTLVQASISKETNIEEAIRVSIKSAILRIKEKEDVLLEQLYNSSSKVRKDLKDKLKVMQDQTDVCKKRLKEVDDILRSGDEAEMTRLLKTQDQNEAGVEVLDEALKSDDDLYKTRLSEDAQIQFKWDESKLNNFLDSLRLVNIPISLKHSFKIVDSKAVKMKGDVDDCWPSDVKVLEVDEVEALVVCDSHNSTLKAYYKRFNQAWESRLLLVGNPWSMAQIKTNAVAVTVPDKMQIFTLAIVPDLKVMSSFATKKKYWGISDLTSTTIAASCCDPPSVDILDKSGTVIRSLTPRIGGQLILKGPYFLCRTLNGNILVSDFGAKSVFNLTHLGDVLFTFSPKGAKSLVTPRGIGITTSGDLLVTDFTQRSVLHLTDSGKFVRNLEIPREVEVQPHGVAVDKQGRLYIADCNDRMILILK